MPKTRLNLHNIMIHKNISRMGNVAHESESGSARVFWLEFGVEMKMQVERHKSLVCNTVRQARLGGRFGERRRGGLLPSAREVK
jgi:hypothetical protein